MPTEVFFDPSKPDGHLSSVTDPPNSMREYVDAKKRKEGKYRTGMYFYYYVFFLFLSSLLIIFRYALVYASTTGQQREERKEPTVAGEDRPDLEAPDNNGLTRGQNFMKVEKWLRNSCMYKQIDITPGDITNIEDIPIEMSENTADPPSEKDRLPPPISNQQHVSTTTKSR